MSGRSRGYTAGSPAVSCEIDKKEPNVTAPTTHTDLAHVHGVMVYGTTVDAQTRCGHWHGTTDIIAIRFHCCGRWFPCFDCHAEHADHPAVVWPRQEFDRVAILCGGCGHQLSVNNYLACGSRCPACAAHFNPGCARHHHLYFEVQDE